MNECCLLPFFSRCTAQSHGDAQLTSVLQYATQDAEQYNEGEGFIDRGYSSSNSMLCSMKRDDVAMLTIRQESRQAGLADIAKMKSVTLDPFSICRIYSSL